MRPAEIQKILLVFGIGVKNCSKILFFIGCPSLNIISLVQKQNSINWLFGNWNDICVDFQLLSTDSFGDIIFWKGLRRVGPGWNWDKGIFCPGMTNKHAVACIGFSQGQGRPYGFFLFFLGGARKFEDIFFP